MENSKHYDQSFKIVPSDLGNDHLGNNNLIPNIVVSNGHDKTIDISDFERDIEQKIEEQRVREQRGYTGEEEYDHDDAFLPDSDRTVSKSMLHPKAIEDELQKYKQQKYVVISDWKDLKIVECARDQESVKEEDEHDVSFVQNAFKVSKDHVESDFRRIRECIDQFTRTLLSTEDIDLSNEKECLDKATKYPDLQHILSMEKDLYKIIEIAEESLSKLRDGIVENGVSLYMAIKDLDEKTTKNVKEAMHLADKTKKDISNKILRKQYEVECTYIEDLNVQWNKIQKDMDIEMEQLYTDLEEVLEHCFRISEEHKHSELWKDEKISIESIMTIVRSVQQLMNERNKDVHKTVQIFTSDMKWLGKEYNSKSEDYLEHEDIDEEDHKEKEDDYDNDDMKPVDLTNSIRMNTMALQSASQKVIQLVQRSIENIEGMKIIDDKECLNAVKKTLEVLNDLSGKMDVLKRVSSKIMDVVRDKTYELSECHDSIKTELVNLIKELRRTNTEQAETMYSTVLEKVNVLMDDELENLRSLSNEVITSWWNKRNSSLKRYAMIESKSQETDETAPTYCLQSLNLFQNAYRNVKELIQYMDFVARIHAVQKYNTAIDRI